MVISLNECKNMVFSKNEESYTFSEYRLKHQDLNEWNKLDPTHKDFDINAVDHWIGRLKSNPQLFKQATACLAVGLQVMGYCASTSFAESYIPGLGPAFDEILNMLFEIAQYSFLALGIKEFVVKILNGGTVKEGISSSLQYAFGFLFIKMYPTIYNKFAKIKF